ncbi:MAG: Nif3-like dinuclear metal center hexameric protein [Firmicutes bacterium]|nr:Nif3-like dinuclear metal center hexameric protein [Bacillota bacterium]
MARVEDIMTIMQEFASEHLIMPEYNDNVGLLIGDINESVKNIYCCLDLTNDDIDKAIDLKVQMIICHHPIIYTPIKSITSKTVLGRKIIKLIKNNIAVYAAHTNLDFVEGGLNEYAAKLLGLKNLIPLNPYISKNAGIGRMGQLENHITLKELANIVLNKFNDKRVDFVGDEHKQIKTVAIINGGGGNLEGLNLAIKMGADCFISGDIKHSTKIYAKDLGFPLIEASHFHTESIYIPQLAKILMQKTKGLNIVIHH